MLRADWEISDENGAGLCVLTAVLKGPWLFASKDPVEDSSVQHPSIETEVVVERWPNVPHGIQLLPHPGALQVLLILWNINT